MFNKSEVTEPSLRIFPKNGNIMFEVKWPKKEFDVNTFANALCVVASTDEKIRHILKQQITYYGNLIHDDVRRDFLLGCLVPPPIMPQLDKIVATKKGPLIKPSQVHRYHFILNNNQGQ